MAKAKMKTHKATAKRFKITGSGKVMRQHSGKNHNTGKKKENNRREVKKWEQVKNSPLAKRIKNNIAR